MVNLKAKIKKNFFPLEAGKISHDVYMRRALALASLGMRNTSPNPLVGCVIVKDNRVIGEGWHKKFGHFHAEIEAINDAKKRGENISGSSVYVTLEPCSHFGKTPPCANRLVDEGVAEVFVAMRDPNPKVDGKGIKILRDAGIKITELKNFESTAKFLNRGFIFAQKYSRPFVTLKAAMSLDGKMCLSNGSSKWLTGILARIKAHEIRAENDAVLVGVGTVIKDNPALTVRHVKGQDPLRVILDAKLSTPPSAKIIGRDEKCMILTGYHAGYDNAARLEDAGAKIFRLPQNSDGQIDLHEALRFLASRGILNLMVEGGPEVLSSFLRERLADYVNVFISPRILGEGRGFSLNMNFENVNEAFNLKNAKSYQLGNDVMLEGRLTCSPDL